MLEGPGQWTFGLIFSTNKHFLSYLVNVYNGQEESLRDLDEMRYDLHISMNAIKDYQDQLRRNYVQSFVWENLIEQDFKDKKSDTAYLTVGKLFFY